MSQAKGLCFLRQEIMKKRIYWRGKRFRLIRRPSVQRAGEAREKERERDIERLYIRRNLLPVLHSFKESQRPRGGGRRRAGDLTAYR